MSGWIALLDAPSGDASSPAREGDADAGWLCSWTSDHAPHRDALRVDARLLQLDGPACTVSWVLLAAGQRPIADDPGVVECRRDVLRDGRPAGVSLLTADPVHVAGAITVALADRPDQVQALADDPFRRLGRGRTLHVGPGLLGPAAFDLAPVVERYAGAPWPHGRW